MPAPDALETQSRTIDAGAGGGPLEAPRLVLIAVADGLGLAEVLPPDGELTIGRGAGCKIRVDHPSVSREHARLCVGPELTIVDLSSRNGTRVHGSPIAPGKPVRIAPGGVLRVGSVTLLVQRIDPVSPASVTLGAPRRSTERPPADHDVVRTSALSAMLDVIDRVADTDISVLLLGETGVGKDVVAELVHRRSERRKGPLVRLHCAAVAPTLLESELFGHERGAFTGALAAKPGLLETAHGGTVFFDEVGDLPPPVQVKLLRVLEDRRVTRVGGVEPRTVDVRFVSATHHDLERDVERGAFRRDLFYRLAGLALLVPALRDQKDEIPALAASFLERAAARAKVGVPRLADDAVHALAAHDWPGNVRELRNVIERAAALAQGGVIRAADLHLRGPVEVRFTGTPPAARVPEPTGDDAARIASAIAKSGGNQTEAAKLLGISRRTLLHRLDALGLPRPRKRTR